MSDTSASLLDRLRKSPDGESWERMVELYSPLIRNWLRRSSVPEQDADDLVQEVLTIVVRRIGDFQREPRTGAFRRWLKTITVNCLRNFWRKKKSQPQGAGSEAGQQMLDQLDDPDSELSRLWDHEHDRHVTQRLLEIIRHQFEPKTWQAFQRVAVDGLPAQQVATELKLTVNAVFIAKSRVLNRLRQEGAGLID